MISRIQILFMCCQVLICPALCMMKCAHVSGSNCSQSVSQAKTSNCPCCPQTVPASGIEESQLPQSPNESPECPDCFCSGSLVMGKDSVAEIDLEQSVEQYVESSMIDGFFLSQDILGPTTNSLPTLFGRDLLRRFCALRI